MNRIILSLLFCSLSLLSISHAFEFNSNGDFTVLQFTDFHYCEADDLDSQTQALQRRLIALVQPDLIILSGDAVSGYAGHYPGFFEQCWRKYTQPFVDAGIYYAYIHGNHDTEADLNGVQIVQLDKTNPYSVLRTADGIPDTTNYKIPIYSSQNQSHIATNIWMLDSGSVGCNGEQDSWGCIQSSYLDWYDQESRLIKEQYGTNVHHVAFYHIPLPEYRLVYNDQPIYGQSNEIVSCPLVNTGFFSRILNNGDITGMFVGHDHINDFAGWYQGVEFVYGRKSGYGGYGTLRGARVIKFKETSDGNGGTTVTRDHYVIQEDETIVTTRVTQVRQGAQETTCPALSGAAVVNSAGHMTISVILAAVIVVLF